MVAPRPQKPLEKNGEWATFAYAAESVHCIGATHNDWTIVSVV